MDEFDQSSDSSYQQNTVSFIRTQSLQSLLHEIYSQHIHINTFTPTHIPFHCIQSLISPFQLYTMFVKYHFISSFLNMPSSIIACHPSCCIISVFINNLVDNLKKCMSKRDVNPSGSLRWLKSFY